MNRLTALAAVAGTALAVSLGGLSSASAAPYYTTNAGAARLVVETKFNVSGTICRGLYSDHFARGAVWYRFALCAVTDNNTGYTHVVKVTPLYPGHWKFSWVS